MTAARLVPILVVALLSCAPRMYYFGEYTDTLYKYKKNPNERTLENHMDELEKIIEVSERRGLRVPPGIYCEYAYYLLQTGSRRKAVTYIEREEAEYPESSVFTTRLKRLIAGAKEDSTATGENREQEHESK